jgi:photosystem II stability/assembly factor-like uncharacterized protein
LCQHEEGKQPFDKLMILRSEDSGDTWRVLDLSKQAGMILDVKFHDPQNGFVCASAVSENGEGEALILRTSDGGKSWTPIAFGKAVNKIRIVRGGAQTRVFAIGVDVHRLDLD